MSLSNSQKWRCPVSYFILGTVLPGASRPAEAESALLRAVELYENMILSEVPMHILCTGLIECYTPLIRLQRNRGAMDEAKQTARRLSLLPVPAYRHTEFASMLHWQGLSDEASQQYEESIRQHEKELQVHADAPRVMSNLARLLATCPVTQLRDAKRAVDLAEKAVTLATTDRSSWNTLGVARLRKGDWIAAIDALERSMELGKGGDSSDWFFLAMALWHLGEKDKARKRFDQAVQWMEKNQERGHGMPEARDLLRFRAESAGLLGVMDKED